MYCLYYKAINEHSILLEYLAGQEYVIFIGKTPSTSLLAIKMWSLLKYRIAIMTTVCSVPIGFASGTKKHLGQKLIHSDSVYSPTHGEIVCPIGAELFIQKRKIMNKLGRANVLVRSLGSTNLYNLTFWIKHFPHIGYRSHRTLVRPTNKYRAN